MTTASPERTCPGCRADAPVDFAFCPRCGTRLSAPATPAPPPPAPPPPDSDRRPVTVLFADLTGFTALSERLDPEDVRALQSDLFQEMSAAIARHDGLVEKFVGDAVMAVFGAPVAHEDDPERALRAALAMQESMAELNRRWAQRAGRPLALHVGINTGPVVAGTIGASADGAYAVTGDTVNTASRLQGAAEPAEVLVSDATHRLAAHAFAFEARGAIALKGKREPLAVYRLVGLRALPGSARGLEALGLATATVGREGELAQLRAAFDAVRAGGGARVISIVGEPGAGKSRLQRELFARLEAAGALAGVTVRRTACLSSGAQPYGVVAGLLRDAYGVDPGDSLESACDKLVAGLEALGVGTDETRHMAALLAQVFGLDSARAELAHLEPEQRKRQIVMAISALVARRLDAGPLVLVVENLHWADAVSVELLGGVANRLADRPLLFVLAYRPTLDALALPIDTVPHLVLRLGPLSSGDGQALLAHWFGDSARACPDRLRALILEGAGGNPLHLEEIVRTLMADGVMVRDGEGWRCTADVEAVRVPATLQGLLLARVDRLPPAARRTLQEAAVIGPAVDVDLLRAIAEQPAGVDATLDVLVQAELLGPDHRFRHGLVQEVVYQNLLLRRRTELHTRAGEALARQVGARPHRLEDLAALGHHWSLGADRLRGARYLVAAGDWARGLYANADAMRHYQRALDTLGECAGAEADTLATHERLADVLGPTGSPAAALEHYVTAEAALRARGDVAARARLHRKMGALHWSAGDRAQALACFETGLALLAELPDHLERAHLYQEMGRCAFRSGDSQRATEWAEQALAQAERLAAASALGADERAEAAAAAAHSYNTLGAALARLGRAEEALRHIERSVALAREHGLLQAACRALSNLGVLYSTMDPGRAIETCTAGLEIATRIGDLAFQSRLYANLAIAYCTFTNRCDEQGVGAAQAAIDLDRRLGQRDHLAVPLIVLGQIYQCHGAPDRAITYYREALAIAEEAGEPQLLYPCYDGLATVHLDLGDGATAERYMQQAQAVCERAGLEPDALVVLPFLD